MNILSIDIGRKNMGYTVLQRTAPYVIYFDVQSIDDKTPITRCQSILLFIGSIHGKYGIADVVVERQVPSNAVAMQLMYVVITSAITIGAKVHIVDPKQKFTVLKVDYIVRNKQHKQQSIQYAHYYIQHHQPELLDSYIKHPKQDDIADSMNQAITWMHTVGMIPSAIDLLHPPSERTPVVLT